MQIPASSGHNRRASARRPLPTAACQIFVTRDGTTRIAAACAGVIRSPSRPIDTVGNPRPITPLTKPASWNAPAIATRVEGASIQRPFEMRRTLLDTTHLDNADHGNPGSDFREGHF